MTFVVAYCVPHNEGSEYGVITGAGFETQGEIVDLFEVDATIKSFDTVTEAEEWLKGKVEDVDQEFLPMDEVPGGLVGSVSYE